MNLGSLDKDAILAYGATISVKAHTKIGGPVQDADFFHVISYLTYMGEFCLNSATFLLSLWGGKKG